MRSVFGRARSAWLRGDGVLSEEQLLQTGAGQVVFLLCEEGAERKINFGRRGHAEDASSRVVSRGMGAR